MIYLDHNATTPVAPSVLEAMLPWFSKSFGNASSGTHALGTVASQAVEEARQGVADLLGCSRGEITFTAGATEANNLAIKGFVEWAPAERRRVLVGTTEHKSVLEAAQALEQQGIHVERIPVDGHGVLSLEALGAMLSEDVAIASVMAANNETGTINPIPHVAELIHACGAALHVDATQWVGKLPLDVRAWDVDLLSLSAHKFYGPKGAGALFKRRGVRLAPLIHGGGQERGVRGGTLNVPAIVGLGAAAMLAADTMLADASRQEQLRDKLHELLIARLPRSELNGHPRKRLPNTLNLRFVGAPADAVLARLRRVAASTGSACTSSSPTPSHVLTAMGRSKEEADESIRFSLGRQTSQQDVEEAVEDIARVVGEVRAAVGHLQERQPV